MTIKKILILSSTLIILATSMLVVSLIVAERSVKATREAQSVKTISLALAEELKESSRELTAAVQKFTVTGDEKYAEDYMDIVLIRSGNKPRPEDRAIAPGETVSLNELMRKAHFTEKELTLLEQSSELSDNLIALEVRAMNAARGIFPDENGNYTVKGQPDKELATGLIFSPGYEKEVAEIMEPLAIFNTELNQRLNDAVASARTDYDNAMKIVWITFGIVETMLVASLLMVAFLIVRPILMCDRYAKQITEGNFDNSLTYTSNNEIGSLASSLRAMVQSLVERIRLKEHARYFDAVISMADAGVIILDKDNLITDWNIGAKNILGLSSEEIIGKSRKFYAPINSYSSIDDIEARLKAGESVARADVERKHKDGKLIVCSASYTPIFDDNGNYNGSIAVFHDVTDSKQAEMKARNLAAIVSIADAGIIIKDKNGAVLEWNIGAENILGYKPGEMAGKTARHYTPEDYWAIIDDIGERLAKGEHFAHVEVIGKHKDGRPVNCSASYTPLRKNNGEFDGSVVIFHDITENKQMDLALKKAKVELEEKHDIIMSSINYASKIQKNLLPSNEVFMKAFEDYAVIWSPRDVVGGDIYWIKNFDEGTVLCVCDCTGHGTPGALLTMLVMSAFENFINESNYKDTAQILWLLEGRLVTALNVSQESKDIKDGCDLAVLFIDKSGHAAISSGNTSVFISDGKEVRRIKGQRLFIGEGRLTCKEDIQTTKISASPGSKFYIASDGLFDQMGGNPKRLIGHRVFMNLMLEHHNLSLAETADIFWNTFEEHRGDEARRDDVELIAFKV